VQTWGLRSLLGGEGMVGEDVESKADERQDAAGVSELLGCLKRSPAVDAAAVASRSSAGAGAALCPEVLLPLCTLLAL